LLLAPLSLAPAAAPPILQPDGADARRARELSALWVQQFHAGRLAEAATAARALLALRRRMYGPGHLETVGARWNVVTLERLSRRPAEVQARFRAIPGQTEEADRLERRGLDARAEPLRRRVLATYRDGIGEEHPLTAGGYRNLALNLKEQGKYAEALALLEKSLAVYRTTYGEEHPLTATAWNGLALVLTAQGRYVQAQPLYEKALALRRKVLGEEHADTATSYNNLALNLGSLDRHAEARALYAKALAIRLKVLGEDHLDTAQSYANVAFARYYQRGRYAEAQPLLEKALAIRRKRQGDDHPTVALACNNLAACLAHQGKHAQAQPLFERALAVRRKVLGEDHPETAASYANLGYNLFSQGLYERAQPYHEKALEIKRRTLGADHPNLMVSYGNVAANLEKLGRHAEAQRHYEQALALARKALGEDHSETGEYYRSLGWALHHQGRHAQAEPFFRRALLIHRQVLGEEHPRTAESYNGLAANLLMQGQWAQAQALFEKALELRRKVLGEGHPLTAETCANLAATLLKRQNNAAARLLLEKALAVRRKVYGEEHPDTAHSYEGLGACLAALGEHAEARACLEKALARKRKVYGARHPAVARCAENLAAALIHAGRHAQAEKVLARASEDLEGALGEKHPEVASCRYLLAVSRHALGKAAGALSAAEKAARAFEHARLEVSFGGLQRASFATQRLPLPLLAVLQARAGQGRQAWATLERSLSRGLLDDLAERARLLAPAEQKQRDDLRNRLRQADRRLEDLLARRDEESRRQAQRLREARDRDQAALSALEAALARKYGPAAGQAYDLKRVQRNLPDDAALVAWVDPDIFLKLAGSGGERWACVVRARGEPAWVRLVGSGAGGEWTEQDGELPQRLRNRLARPAGAAAWAETAGRLHLQRLAPLAKYLGAGAGLPAARHLIVLPSANLAGVPLEVLLAGRPEGAPGYTVSYAPSATLFAWLSEQTTRVTAARAPRLLALGDPAFAPAYDLAARPPPPASGLLLTRVLPGRSAARAGLRPGDVLLRYGGAELKRPADLMAALKKSAPGGAGKGGVEAQFLRAGKVGTVRLPAGPLGLSVDRQAAAEAVRARRRGEALLARVRGEGFKPLPGTRREVEALARLFGKADTLLGEQARAARLAALAERGELKGYRYLHLATHGLADAEHPMESFLALARNDATDPLNHFSAPAPGRLTAGEILGRWRLDADLVVLSACSSGLGRYERGEGYIGFAQALFLAGARSLVVSQWEVDDEATTLLMVRFYTNLLGKRPGLKAPLGKAAALAEAKQWLRNLSEKEAGAARASLPRGKVVTRTRAVVGPKPYAHPYYWAAFVLVGDPR
jgi:CHAT domain-containing protein/tetratricopeptide (TPR) repeat protein